MTPSPTLAHPSSPQEALWQVGWLQGLHGGTILSLDSSWLHCPTPQAVPGETSPWSTQSQLGTQHLLSTRSHRLESWQNPKWMRGSRGIGHLASVRAAEAQLPALGPQTRKTPAGHSHRPQTFGILRMPPVTGNPSPEARPSHPGLGSAGRWEPALPSRALHPLLRGPQSPAPPWVQQDTWLFRTGRTLL